MVKLNNSLFCQTLPYHLLLCGVLDLRNDCVLWNFLKYITVCMFAILYVNA